jgi:uncharacterized protein (TIGR03437 family)
MKTACWTLILAALTAAQSPMAVGLSSNVVMLEEPGTILRSALTGNGRFAAPESLVAAYARSAPLALAEQIGNLRNPESALGGTTVRVIDSAGNERMAPLLYVAPAQVNLQIPRGTATGWATLVFSIGSTEVSRAALEIRPIAPEVMQTGTYPNAVLMRIREGATGFEPLVRLVDGWIEVTPIDFGPPSDELFLLVFGTGVRGRTSPSAVKAVVDSVELPVEYVGPQGELAGIDQIVIRLPRSLSEAESKYPYFTILVDGLNLVNADGDDMYLPIQ